MHHAAQWADSGPIPSESPADARRHLSEIARALLSLSGADEADIAHHAVLIIDEPCALFRLESERPARLLAVHPAFAAAAITTCTQALLAGNPLADLAAGRTVVLEQLSARVRNGAPSSPAGWLFLAPVRHEGALIGVFVLAEREDDGRDSSEAASAADLATLVAPSLGQARLKAALAREHQLRQQSAAELSALFGSELAIQGLLDAQGRLKLASPGFARLVNRPIESLLGLSHAAILDLLRDVDPLRKHEEIVARLANIARDPTALVTEDFRFDLDSGPILHLRLSTGPVLAGDGTPVGRYFICMDVTEERERNARRAEFLSVAAHELRTPLQPLTIQLGAIERNIRSGLPVSTTLAGRARGQLKRVNMLIDELLEVERMDSTRLELHCESVEPVQLLEGILRDFALARPERVIHLTPAQEPLRVFGDRERLRQVIVHLLQNALKYSPQESVVWLVVERMGAEVRLSVSDEGVGIPQDEQRRLFQRFHRGRHARAENYGGFGMGLFISRQIVERHKGRFEVVSAPGAGATFSFFLPLESDRPVS